MNKVELLAAIHGAVTKDKPLMARMRTVLYQPGHLVFELLDGDVFVLNENSVRVIED
jgi:hypothetical protein